MFREDDNKEEDNDSNKDRVSNEVSGRKRTMRRTWTKDRGRKCTDWGGRGNGGGFT